MTDVPPRSGKSKQATIADVARIAGVAQGSVSNYLNGTVPVSEDIRGRVAKAIAVLNFEPSEIARSFTSRRRSGRLVDRFAPETPRLTTVGYASVDYIAQVSEMPHEGTRMLAPEIRKAVGGPAANVAAIAAGLGGAWTIASSLITAVGTDLDSDWAISELASRNVDVITPVEQREGRLARALVLVDPEGRRAIIAEPLSLGRVQLSQFIESANLNGRKWCIHLEGYQIPHQIDLMQRAREVGFLTAMHATGLPKGWLGQNADMLFSVLDVVVLQRERLAELPGCPMEQDAALAWLSERLSRYGDAGPQALVVTFGAAGAAVVTRKGGVSWSRALAVEVVDETGAGDALTGTFLALWLNGVPPAEALDHACAVGSLVVTRLGAQELRPTSEDLKNLTGSDQHIPSQAELLHANSQEQTIVQPALGLPTKTKRNRKPLR